jgi:ankyrin repeat protein
LLTLGADHTIRNKNDETALDLAALSDNSRVFMRVVQKFINFNSNNPDQINELFDYENKCNGMTLLTRLVLRGKFKLAKLLFNSKVNVNYQHKADGDTVLHKCIKSGDKKAIGFALYIG